MRKEQFAQKMQKLLPTCNMAETTKKWIAWAEECVESEQYPGFVERPFDDAVCAWLDSYYASLYFIRKDFGEEIAGKVFELANVGLCLYPYEMEKAAKELQAGSSTNRIEQLMLEGLLEIDYAKTPTLEDVRQDMRKKQGRER